jgi:proteasome accessory factor C
VSGAQAQVARLLSLLPYLLAHPGAKVSDVTRVFGITERQLVRDLDVLWFTGLPGLLPGDLIEVDMEAVHGEGVIKVSNADYLSRPLRLGSDEAVALLVALRSIAAMPGVTDTDAVARAIAKLEAASGDAALGMDGVRVEAAGRFLADTAATVRKALEQGRRLHLSYWVPGRDETTERDVDPMRLAVVQGKTYLEGWCRLAGDVRLFRLDRIEKVQILDLPAEPPNDAKPRDLSVGAFRPSPDDELVTLEVEPGGRWLAEYYPCENVEEIGDDRLRIQLRTADRRWLVRLALRLGPEARIVDPQDLAARVRRAAREALAAYQAAAIG